MVLQTVAPQGGRCGSWLAAFVSAVLCAALSAGPAFAAQKLALVIGNARYSGGAFGELINAGNDMQGMTNALKGMGFDTVDQLDAGLPAFRGALDNFTRKIQPDDLVVVYYAGHGVMGVASKESEALENYLVPVDATRTSMSKAPPDAVGLGHILEALDRARAGPRIVIMDACRQNLAEAGVGPTGVVQGSGLVQPSGAALRRVFIAYAVPPGKTAGDGDPADKHGVFTGELLRRLSTPGLTVTSLFEQVSTSVDHATQGEQVPWFASGDGTVGNVVLNPARSAGAAPDVADPLIPDLRLMREALSCGLPVCLEAAVAQVRTASLKDILLTRAKSIRAASRASGAGSSAAPPPALLGMSPPAAAAYLRANPPGPGAWVEVADRMLSGQRGFEQDAVTALRWYRAAAEAGSGAGAYAVGSLYHRGAPGVARNEAEAYRWFVLSGELKHPAAFAQLGDYEVKGLGGRRPDDQAGARWFQTGAQLGDPISMRRLADFTADGRGGIHKSSTEAGILWRKAAKLGDTEAMRRTGDWASGAEAFAWYKQAAELGDLAAYGQVALDYEVGQGVAKDEVEALRWRLAAAERGSGGDMLFLALAYEQGNKGLPVDCRQAGVWLRRAAVTGERSALAKLYSGRDRYSSGVCASYR